MTASGAIIERARAVIPGGVNSPVRAFRSVGQDPVVIREASGARVTTVDGEVLIDYVLSWGPLLLGHAHPAVRSAVEEALRHGTSYGFTCPAEVELAELVVSLVPSVEMLRFVNSGTEATMAAVRLARAATGRDLILKFEGCYHGHADGFLVAAGSGVATLGLPDSPGVPAPLAALTVTVPFNDLDQVETAFTSHPDAIAAVIVEPYVGNAGFIPPLPGFLGGLRDLSTRHGTLLIFDEVMTGFRVSAGGAQGATGVMPDLTTLGKVIGGGLPVGAYGGRTNLMSMVAPAGPVYQAGTLSGNPLAMAAGLATLRTAVADDLFSVLEGRTRMLVDGIAAAGTSVGVPLTVEHAGSMWGLFFREGPVTSFAEARASDTALFARFHREARRNGILLAPSAFEAGFISIAHTEEIIAETVERLADALARAVRA